MKYGELTLGQIEAMVNKLGGMDGVRRFLAGETVVRAVEQLEFKVWKTIKLGGLKSAKNFCRALEDSGCRVGDWARDMLGQKAFRAAVEEIEVDLVRATVAQLGFPKGATRKDIYERAESLGLAQCPAEVGPQLRLQYRDQPNGEWLLIAMEPITASDGHLSVFYVDRFDDDLWLDSGHGYPDYVWDPVLEWVFVRPRK